MTEIDKKYTTIKGPLTPWLFELSEKQVRQFFAVLHCIPDKHRKLNLPTTCLEG